jgi:hypothetical protein
MTEKSIVWRDVPADKSSMAGDIATLIQQVATLKEQKVQLASSLQQCVEVLTVYVEIETAKQGLSAEEACPVTTAILRHARELIASALNQ